MNLKTWTDVGRNIVGTFVPFAVALIALPIIASNSGVERLGLLGLAWTLVGQLGVLDFGMSRVLTRRIASAGSPQTLLYEAIILKRTSQILGLTSTAVALVIGLTMSITGFVDGLVSNVVSSREITFASWLMLAAVPASIVSGVLRGALEGCSRFASVNRMRVFFGAWNFLMPALASFVTPTLPLLVTTIVIGRFLAVIAHAYALRGALPWPTQEENIVVAISPVLKEGGWQSISGFISPVMASLDRLFVASIVSAEAAGYYFVPQELALRALLLAAALTSVLFPRIARAHARQDSLSAGEMTQTSCSLLLVAGLIVCGPFAAFSHVLLEAWMGPRFANHSAPLASILSLGLLACFIAQAPFSALQATGRADLTAKLHVIELPLFLIFSTALTYTHGSTGAAVAWSARFVIDCCGLLWIANREGLLRFGARGYLLLVAALAVTGLLACISQMPDGTRSILGILSAFAFLLVLAIGGYRILTSIQPKRHKTGHRSPSENS